MKYYKDPEDKIFAFNEDGSQDDFIPKDAVAVVESDALEILRKQQEAEIEKYVPSIISRFQMLSVLKISKQTNGESMYQVLNSYINDLPDDASDNTILKTAWELSPEFGRDSLLVETAKKVLKLTKKQMDELFKKGGSISA